MGSVGLKVYFNSNFQPQILEATTTGEAPETRKPHRSKSPPKNKSKKEDMLIVVSQTNPPFQIALFSNSVDQYISKTIANKRVYEPDETEFIRSVFRDAPPQSWAVDIGANVGFHTLHMASLGARVLCFEPSNDTAELLRNSIRSNEFYPQERTPKGFVKLIQAAASESSGIGRLKRHPDSPGMTVLQTIGDDKATNAPLPFGLDDNEIQTDIKMVRAETILDENKVSGSLRLLKVDAEGHELHAFRGVNLRKYPFEYVAFELFPSLLWKAGNTDPVDLLVYLTSFGYRCAERPSAVFSGRIADGFKTEEEARVWYQNRALKRRSPPRGTGFDEGFHTNLFCKKSGTPQR